MKEYEQDYLELKNIITDYPCDKSLHDLCVHLGGHNEFSDHLFDVNFKSIIATVLKEDGLFKLSPSIEYYYSDDSDRDYVDSIEVNL